MDNKTLYWIHLTQDKEYAQRLQAKFQNEGRDSSDYEEKRQRAQDLIDALQRKYKTGPYKTK